MEISNFYLFIIVFKLSIRNENMNKKISIIELKFILLLYVKCAINLYYHFRID